MNVEFADEVAGIYFRSVWLANVGDVGTQHVHDYDHATFCGQGAAKFYANGAFQCVVTAGQAVKVGKGVQHHFEALQPRTLLACVHIAESAEAAQSVPLLQEVA